MLTAQHWPCHARSGHWRAAVTRLSNVGNHQAESLFFFFRVLFNPRPLSNCKICIILQMSWSLIQLCVNGRVTVTSLCGYSTNLTSLFRSESVWLCRSASLQEMCMPAGFIPAFCLGWFYYQMEFCFRATHTCSQ